MHRSSICSTSFFHELWLSLPIVAAIIGGLLLAEGAARLAVAVGTLPSPEPYLWHRPEVHTKLRQMQALASDKPIDVLFVGSSVAYAGIDPALFDSEVEALTGRSVVSYNAGLGGLPISMVDAFVEQVFSRYISPKTLILLMAPRDVNKNNLYNDLMVQEVTSSPYGKVRIGTGIGAAVTRLLLEHSVLFRYRNLIMLTALNGLRVPTELPAAYDDPRFDSRGYEAIPRKLTDRLVGDEAPKRDLAMGRAFLRAFKPSRKDLGALEKLIGFCETRGIRLIVVNMPMNHYLQASFEHPAEDYAVYLNTLTALTERHRVPLWDANNLSEEHAFADDEFYDLTHLNVRGAESLTKLVAIRYSQLQGQSSLPRVFEVSRSVPVGRAIEDILLPAEYSLDNEWEGQVRYLPLR